MAKGVNLPELVSSNLVGTKTIFLVDLFPPELFVLREEERKTREAEEKLVQEAALKKKAEEELEKAKEKEEEKQDEISDIQEKMRETGVGDLIGKCYEI